MGEVGLLCLKEGRGLCGVMMRVRVKVAVARLIVIVILDTSYSFAHGNGDAFARDGEGRRGASIGGDVKAVIVVYVREWILRCFVSRATSSKSAYVVESKTND